MKKIYLNDQIGTAHTSAEAKKVTANKKAPDNFPRTKMDFPRKKNGFPEEKKRIFKVK